MFGWPCISYITAQYTNTMHYFISTLLRYHASTCFALIFSSSSGGQVFNVAMVLLLHLKRLSAGLQARVGLLYSAFGKSLCTYKRCWKWCPRASIQAWTRLILFANTFCRSAFGKSLCTYKSCWKWCPRASVQAWTRLTLFANIFCRSAFGNSLCTYKRCWKCCPRASMLTTKSTYRSLSEQRLSERTVFASHLCLGIQSDPFLSGLPHLCTPQLFVPSFITHIKIYAVKLALYRCFLLLEHQSDT
jgi:hypothetical protein